VPNLCQSLVEVGQTDERVEYIYEPPSSAEHSVDSLATIYNTFAGM